MIQIINSGGIIETTVGHSDMRGLGTACHGFVVELPRLKLDVRPYTIFHRLFEGFPSTVIASLSMIADLIKRQFGTGLA